MEVNLIILININMQKKQISKINEIVQNNKLNEEFSYVYKAINGISQIFTSNKVQGLYVSFNGGKDATVVLFLTYFALRQVAPNTQINCIYFKEADPFHQAEQFMRQMKILLNLNIFICQSKNYSHQLTNFSNSHSIEWIVMGSRKNDPYCSDLGFIAESDVDKGYPPFKRINAIIEWDYSQVWAFIHKFEIPFCQLYAEGYTSLGEKSKTTRNQSLYDQKSQKYIGAWLAQSKDQRIGRKQKTAVQLSEQQYLKTDNGKKNQQTQISKQQNNDKIQKLD